MKKYPLYRQDDQTTCGVYAMKMILKYYGINEDASTLKMKGKVDASGMTLKGIIETLKSYQIEAEGYKSTIEQLSTAHLPLILHTMEDDIGHFCVLYEIKNDMYVVGDPGKGLIKLSKEELQKKMTGYLILVTHIGRYYDYHEETFQSYLKNTYKLYKKEIHRLIWLSIMLSILSFLITSLYTYMIDFLHTSSPFFYSLFVVGGYGLFYLIKIGVNRSKESHTIFFNRELDKEYVYHSVIRTLRLPNYVYMQDVGVLHSKLLNLYELSDYTVNFFKAVFVDGIMTLCLLIGIGIISLLMLLISSLSLIFIFLYVYFKSQKFHQLYKDYLQAHHRHSSQILEFIQKRQLGKQFVGYQKWKQRYEHFYENEANTNEDRQQFLSKMNAGIEVLSLCGSLFLLLCGLYFYHQKMMSLGVVFLTFMIQNLLIPMILSLCGIFCEYKESILLFEHYKEFSLKENEGQKHFCEHITSISLTNVSFAYGYHSDILKHFDLTISKSLFFIGSNGGGKSTFLKLLRGYDDYRGQILINQISLKDIKKRDLEKKIIYLSENGDFIKDSLLHNFFIEEDKVIDLLSKFKLEDYFEKLAYPIQDDGMPLSVGQKQIVTILRSLLFDFDVYMFDETFSHIDLLTAKRLIYLMKKYYPEKIFLIVTHRKNLMNKNDEYVIIEDGKVKAMRKKR